MIRTLLLVAALVPAPVVAQGPTASSDDACSSTDFFERLSGCREFWLEYAAQWEDQDPCELLAPPRFDADGYRIMTFEEADAHGRCANYRAAVLQEILFQAGIPCAAFDLINGECDVGALYRGPAPVIPGADSAEQIEALDQMIDVLTEGIVVE